MKLQRPRSAYMLFVKDVAEKKKINEFLLYKNNINTAEMWQALDDSEKKYYFDKHEFLKKQYHELKRNLSGV